MEPWPWLYLILQGGVLPPSAEAYGRPNAHPRTNRMVTKCDTYITWVYSKNWNSPPPQVSALTWVYSLSNTHTHTHTHARTHTCTHTQHFLILKINPGRNDPWNLHQENPVCPNRQKSRAIGNGNGEKIQIRLI